MSADLVAWLNSGAYLPPFLRDFHDQKDVFKSIHLRLEKRQASDPEFTVMPASWRDAHVYTIDAFLWFMARCGYTLQRSRKKLDYTDIYEFREVFRREWLHPWDAPAPEGSRNQTQNEGGESQ